MMIMTTTMMMPIIQIMKELIMKVLMIQVGYVTEAHDENDNYDDSVNDADDQADDPGSGPDHNDDDYDDDYKNDNEDTGWR